MDNNKTGSQLRDLWLDLRETSRAVISPVMLSEGTNQRMRERETRGQQQNNVEGMAWM